MDFVRAESRGRREAVFDQLLSYIAQMKNAAGTQLPTEGELAEMFGVSRTVIREAMRSLQATGVIRIEQGRGTFVSEHPFSQPFGVWASLNSHRISDLFEMRVILEGESAARAAARATPEELAPIEAALISSRAQASAGDWAGTMASDREFHRLITRLADVPMLSELFEVMLPSWIQVTANFGRESDRELRIRSVIKEHQSVFDSLRDGDAELARRAMQRHLRSSLQRRLKSNSRNQISE